MNMGNIIPGFPARFWESMIDMGRRSDWMRMKIDKNATPEEPRTLFEIDHTKLSPWVSRTIRAIKSDSKSALALPWFATLAEMAANGPKVFRPTLEQCEAMEHVEIKLPLNEYRQPFRAMAIQFPEEYRKSLADRTGGRDRIPLFILTQFWDGQNGDTSFFSGCSFNLGDVMGNSRDVVDETYFFSYRPGTTIEDWLQRHIGEKSAGSAISEAMTRVAMNLMLLLTQYPTTLAPSAPAALNRARANVKMAGPIGTANRIEAATHVHTIRLAQDIIVRETRTGPRIAGEPTGREMPPHWRKGHWRNQHYGTGNAQTKRMFIRPLFIRSDAFTGDLGQTSSVYRPAAVNPV